MCPQCGSEFVATAERCSDCNVALVHPDEMVDEETPADELPPISEMAPVRIASVEWIRGFSEVLQDADIPHRVGPPPETDDATGAQRRSHDLGMALYVLPDDHAQAVVLDNEYLRSQIPDAPDAEDDARRADSDGCPACGDPVGPDDAECPGCGLPFIEIE
jgi:hypothetical protein